jgi:hypothetical protein
VAEWTRSNPHKLPSLDEYALLCPCLLLLPVYELKGVGLDGQEKLFQKPWAMTTTMFLGECTWKHTQT